MPIGVFITDELLRRPPTKTDYLQEKVALQDLALQMADHPAEVLPHLVDLAIDICGGISGGISLYEDKPAPGVFRWHYLRGDLEKFTGETTPRDFSPCGVTLDLGAPVLAEHPERYYTWLVEAGLSLPECLLVPLFVGGTDPLGTLWIVAPNVGHFDSGHSRIMTELAAFAGMALHMVRTEARLQQAFEKQERLAIEQETLAGEMSHRIQNLFAIFGGMVRISARSAATPEDMSEILSGRLAALAATHAVVRRTLDDKGVASQGAELGELVPTILKPYGSADASEPQRCKIDGPLVRLSDRATNGFALFLHEFATNAAKYGALTIATGSVQVSWRREGRFLVLTWEEQGGPAIRGEPTTQGFGSALATNTIVGQLGGTLLFDWRATGLFVTVSVPLAKLLD